MKPYSIVGVDESNGRERTCVINAFRKDGVIKITSTVTFDPPINYASAAYYKAVSRPLYRQHGYSALQQLPQQARMILQRLIDQKPDLLKKREDIYSATPKELHRYQMKMFSPDHIYETWLNRKLSRRTYQSKYGF